MTRPRPEPGAERGSITTEVVIIIPVVVLLLMLVLQFALYYHGANVATAAAQDGLRASRVEEGSPSAGQARAREIVAHSAGSLFDDLHVTTSRNGHAVRVEVTGTVASLLPGVHLRVTRVAEGPVEEFLPPSQR